MLVSFDGIAEFGGPIANSYEDRDVWVTIKYPQLAPMKLSLKSGGTSLTPAGRAYPVYRATALEQNDLRLSLRTGPHAELTDIIVPEATTTGKPDLTTEAPDSESK